MRPPMEPEFRIISNKWARCFSPRHRRLREIASVLVCGGLKLRRHLIDIMVRQRSSRHAGDTAGELVAARATQMQSGDCHYDF